MFGISLIAAPTKSVLEQIPFTFFLFLYDVSGRVRYGFSGMQQ
jgi:hypothetical protein